MGAHAAAPVEAGVQLSTTWRANPAGWMSFQDAVVARPWVKGRPAPGVSGEVAVDLRLHGPSAVDGLASAVTPAALQPGSVRWREARLVHRGAHADVHLGLGRVAWGAGLPVSHVDSLQPAELTDPTRFDQRLSTPFGRVLLHHARWTAEAMVLPFFTPAALPAVEAPLLIDGDRAFDRAGAGAPGLQVGALRDTTALPTGLRAASAGLRLRWAPEGVDLGLTAVHGPDPLPQADGELIITGYQTDAGRVDLGVPLRHPERQLVGLDWRLPMGDALLAGEVAALHLTPTALVPSQRQLEALVRLGTLDAVPDPLPRAVTQGGGWLPQGILAVERPFGPLRVQVGGLWGLPTERRREDQRPYALGSAAVTFSPTWRLHAAAAADVRDGGALADAELRTLLDDQLELLAGGTWVSGPDGSTLGALAAARHARVGARLSW